MTGLSSRPVFSPRIELNYPPWIIIYREFLARVFSSVLLVHDSAKTRVVREFFLPADAKSSRYVKKITKLLPPKEKKRNRAAQRANNIVWEYTTYISSFVEILWRRSAEGLLLNFSYFIRDLIFCKFYLLHEKTRIFFCFSAISRKYGETTGACIIFIKFLLLISTQILFRKSPKEIMTY